MVAHDQLKISCDACYKERIVGWAAGVGVGHRASADEVGRVGRRRVDRVGRRQAGHNE